MKNFSEPNTTAISTSIMHRLQVLDGQITCNISFYVRFNVLVTMYHYNFFQPIEGCPDYSVSFYLLTLQELNFNNTLVLGPSVDPQFTLNSSYIRENLQYSYTVEAINSINISSGIKARNFSECNDVPKSYTSMSMQPLLTWSWLR